jgi:hypothetical protein
MKPEIKTTREVVFEAANHRDTQPDMLFKDSEAWKRFSNKRWVSCEDEVKELKKILIDIIHFGNIHVVYIRDAIEKLEQHMKHLEGQNEKDRI